MKLVRIKNDGYNIEKAISVGYEKERVWYIGRNRYDRILNLKNE